MCFLKKRILRILKKLLLASEILRILDDNSNTRHTRLIPDKTDTKLYSFKTITIKKRSPPKYTLPINFDNTVAELIRISQILSYPK